MALSKTVAICTGLGILLAGSVLLISVSHESTNSHGYNSHSSNASEIAENASFAQRARDEKGAALLSLLGQYELDERKKLINSIPSYDVPIIFEKMCVADTPSFESVVLKPMEFSELAEIFWRWQSQKPMINMNFQRQELFDDPVQFQYNIRKYLTICERVVMQILTQQDQSS